MTPITDKREILKREIASLLDLPSIYMGGPSQGNLRRAAQIIEHIEMYYGISASSAHLNDLTQETPR